MADRRYALIGHTHTDLGGLQNIVEDLTPQLGGTLDGNNFEINLTGGKHFQSTSNTGTFHVQLYADDTNHATLFSNWDMRIINSSNPIHVHRDSYSTNVQLRLYGVGSTLYSTFEPLGITGQGYSAFNFDIDGYDTVSLGNFKFDINQTVGAGQDNYVLTYDNATGLISLEAGGTGGWPVLTYGQSLDSRDSGDTADIGMVRLNSGKEVVLGPTGEGALGVICEQLFEPKSSMYSYGNVRMYNSAGTKYASTVYSSNDVIHGHLSTTNSTWQGISGYYQFKDGTGFYINDGANFRVYNASDNSYMQIHLGSGSESNNDAQFNMVGDNTWHTHFTGHTSFKIAGNHLRLYRTFTGGASGTEFRISADPNAAGKIVTFHDKYNDFRAVTWNLGGSTGNVWEFHADYTSFDGYIQIGDGVTAPSSTTGVAKIYVDSADGDLKVIFGDGTVKTIATDT